MAKLAVLPVHWSVRPAARHLNLGASLGPPAGSPRRKALARFRSVHDLKHAACVSTKNWGGGLAGIHKQAQCKSKESAV